MLFKKKSGVIFLTVWSCLFLLLSNCQVPDSQRETSGLDLSDPQKKESTILEIENTLYSNTDFDRYIRATLGDDQESLTVVSLSRLFDSFIEEKLLLQAARMQDMVLSEKEKEDYLAELSDEFSGEEGQASLDEMDTDILFERLLIEKYKYDLVRDLEVTDVEIKAYYEYNRRSFLRPERVKVSQILLETEAKAILVMEKVTGASETEFRKVAQDESVGLEALKGGEMGIFEMGQLPFEMERVIFSLEEGELSPVVESSYGFHIFRVDKKYSPELISEEEASELIREEILDQKIKLRISSHLEALKSDMDWTFYPLNLPFPYQRIET